MAAFALVVGAAIDEGSEAVPVGLDDGRSDAGQPAVSRDQVDEQLVASEASGLTDNLRDSQLLHLLALDRNKLLISSD